MEKEIRISFFKRLKMSIFDFDKYHIIASEGLGRAMMYLVKLMLLFAVVISIATVIKLSQLLDDGLEFYSQNVPNFHFENNQFILENDGDYVVENHEYVDFKVILTNSETYNEDEIRNFDGLVAVFTKNHMLVKQQNSTSITTQTYEELSNTVDLSTVNKDYVYNMFTGENAYAIQANIFAVILIVMFFTYFFTAILNTIALSLLGLIVSRLIRMPLKYSSIYSLGISSITLPTILNAIYLVVNLFTGFVIPYFQLMYTLISYVYLIAALLIMRSEIIKKKVKIQVAIMNKNFDSEKMQNPEKKKEEDNKDKKEKNKENKQPENKKEPDNKLKNNKDNPEPQANIQEK